MEFGLAGKEAFLVVHSLTFNGIVILSAAYMNTRMQHNSIAPGNIDTARSQASQYLVEN